MSKKSILLSLTKRYQILYWDTHIDNIKAAWSEVFFRLLQYQMIIMQTNHLTLLHTFTYFYTCRIGLISKTEKFKVNTNYCCMLKQKLRLHEGVNKRPIKFHPLIAWIIRPTLFIYIGLNNVLSCAVKCIL